MTHRFNKARQGCFLKETYPSNVQDDRSLGRGTTRLLHYPL